MTDSHERVLQWWREIGTDACLAALDRGVLSEGQATSMLGLDRVSVRGAVDDLRLRGGVYHDGLSRRIVRALELGERSPRDVARALDEEPRRVAQNLVRLHQRGHVVRLGRGRYSLPKNVETQP